MRIYLDNNATTAVDPAVLAVFTTALRDVSGNASSVHKEGQSARRTIERAREEVARLIGATPRELIFSSGGTESNNAAIFGAMPTGGRFHIVTTAIEHPSALEPLRELEKRGCELSVVRPRRSGRVDPDEIASAIRPDTALVVMMFANNETGVIQPVEQVGALCRARGIHFHCDAVQAGGKIAIDVRAIGCDTLALSAHKMHAPKGVGALYVRSGTVMQSLIVGGAQERRRRAGTENVPAAAAFAAAATLPDRSAEIASLRDRFESALLASGLELAINGREAPRIPNTSNVTFVGGDGEGIVIALDLEGVAVSTGSACSSGRVEPSPVLLAMGLSPAEARATVRFSLSRYTTAEEIDRVVELVRGIVGRAKSQASRSS